MKYIPWLLLVVGLIAWFFWPSPTIVHELGRIDTVRVDKVLPRDTIMIPSAPEIVYIYKEADTAARAKAEKGDILTAVNVSRNLVTVDKLTPRGIGIRQEYTLPELAAVRIDGQGNTEITPDKKARRRKFWRKVEVIGVGIAGIFIGTKI